jgi:hypothetical protein
MGKGSAEVIPQKFHTRSPKSSARCRSDTRHFQQRLHLPGLVPSSINCRASSNLLARIALTWVQIECSCPLCCMSPMVQSCSLHSSFNSAVRRALSATKLSSSTSWSSRSSGSSREHHQQGWRFEGATASTTSIGSSRFRHIAKTEARPSLGPRAGSPSPAVFQHIQPGALPVRLRSTVSD